MKGLMTCCFMTRKPCILLSLLPSEKKGGREGFAFTLSDEAYALHTFLLLITGVAEMAGVARSGWHYCNE